MSFVDSKEAFNTIVQFNALKKIFHFRKGAKKAIEYYGISKISDCKGYLEIRLSGPLIKDLSFNISINDSQFEITSMYDDVEEALKLAQEAFFILMKKVMSSKGEGSNFSNPYMDGFYLRAQTPGKTGKKRLGEAVSYKLISKEFMETCIEWGFLMVLRTASK